jgi:hypothetical protein
MILNRIFAFLAAATIVVICAVDPVAAALAAPAPGPIAGVGLPILAIGLGAYWLVRRFRRKTD